MSKSKIEWTQETWNPVTGCSKVSPGCQNCYAERMAKRLQAMGHPNYKDGFEVRMHEHMLDKPLSWAKPRMVFVNSMGDLFHEKVSDCFIKQVFSVMNSTPQHTYQLVTKRATRLQDVATSLGLTWSKNIWMGVTVENSDQLDRVAMLKTISSEVKFLSVEPLLGPLPGINLERIDWVIVGGESGPHSRPMEKAWATEIRDECVAQSIPFFFKQWGGTRKKLAGRLLDGREWNEMPRRKGIVA